MSNELVERARRYADYEDHQRLCQGREYTCTCGYDDKRDPLIHDLCNLIEELAQSIIVMAERSAVKTKRITELEKREERMQEGDRVKMGDRSGVVQAVNGDAVMVTFDGEAQNEIVDVSKLTKEGEQAKQDQEPERGPDQDLSPGLHTNEQRFGSEILRDKLSSDDGE